MADEMYDEVIVDWDAADNDPDAVDFDDFDDDEADTNYALLMFGLRDHVDLGGLDGGGAR